jgi:hypothetical protein
MQQAVFRDGRLYTSLIFNGRVAPRFAVSSDDGLTWALVDQVPPYATDEIQAQTNQFAPDYYAAGAWFRFTLRGSRVMSLPHITTLDRSIDDGRTWATVTPLGTPAGSAGALLPAYGRPLVTAPEQPEPLCVGRIIWVPVPGLRVPLQDLVLGSSSESGATWRFSRITPISQDDAHQGFPG